MRTTEAQTAQIATDLVAPDPVIRRFEIWPHRSIGPKGIAALFGVLAASWAFAAYSVPKPMLWPIVLACAAAFIAVAVAYGSNIRAARAREILEIGPRNVHLHRIASDGSRSVASFTTGWVNVQLSNDRQLHNRLVLSQSGRRISVGAFLSPTERADLARAVEKALSEARLSSR